MNRDALSLLPSPAMAAAGLSLRREGQSDLAFVRALYGEHRAAELAVTGWDDAMKQRFLDHQFAAQSMHLKAYRADADYLIVMRDDGPVGRLYVDRTADPWRLVEIALVGAETRRGGGTALIEWLVDRATTGGATAIDLHVVIDNPAAAAFYARRGFIDVPSDFETHRRLLRRLDGVN